MSEQSHARMIESMLYLLQADRYVTLDELAAHASISKRTTQKDIDSLKEWIIQSGLGENLALLSQSGRGIRLELRDMDQEDLRSMVTGEKGVRVGHDNYGRRIEMIKYLLYSPSGLTMQFLADHFYVSKSVVQKDLLWVNKWLLQYGLLVKKCQNKGVHILGDEISRRNAIADLVDISDVLSRECHDLDEFSNRVNLLRLDLKKFYLSLHMKPKVDIGKIAEIIQNTEVRYGFHLANTYYTALLIHLTISVERLCGGLGVVSKDNVPDGIIDSRAGEIAGFIAAGITEQFHVEVPYSERVFIGIHILGANAGGHSLPSLTADFSSEMAEFAGMIALFVQTVIEFPFAGDGLLLSGLAAHLKTALYRLRSGLTGQKGEPRYAATLRQQYTALYRAVWASGCLYQSFYSLIPNDEEISSICLHFINSMRRQQTKFRALLLYDESIASAMRLFDKISALSPNLVVSDICLLGQFETLDRQDFDLIISPFPQEGVSVPCFCVSDNPRPGELEAISGFVERHLEVRRDIGDNMALPRSDLRIACKTLEEMSDIVLSHLIENGYDRQHMSGELFEMERSGRALPLGDRLYFILYVEAMHEERAFEIDLETEIDFGGAGIKHVSFVMLHPQSVKDRKIESTASLFF